MLQPIKSITRFWVVTRHQTSLLGETVGGVANVICFLRTLITHNSSDNVVKWVLHRKNIRHPSSPPPPLHSKLGYWLFPTILSPNTSTKLHGGGRGGKATFFSCEVGEMSEALERESSQLILSPIAALPDINWNSKCRSFFLFSALYFTIKNYFHFSF